MSRIPPGVRQQVLARDRYVCVAPNLDRAAGECRDAWGNPGWDVPIVELELDHVRPEPMMGKTAPSEPEFLVTLCPWHHQGREAGRNWATSHRPLLREYLARKADEISRTPPPAPSEVQPDSPAHGSPGGKRGPRA